MTRAWLLLLVLLTPLVVRSESGLLPGGAAPAGLFVDSFEAAMVIGDVGAWRRAAEALSDETDDGRRLLARGIAEHVIGRDAAARDSLSHALELGADRAVACFHLGLALRVGGRDEEALRALECAREAAPEQLAVLEELAASQRDARRPLAAIATLETAWSVAAARGPADERRVLMGLVPLLLSAGEDARAAAARLVVLAPDHARVWYWQAQVLEWAGAEGVGAALERAAALSGEPALMVELARVHRRRSEDDRARDLLEAAAEAAPELAAPHEVLGDHWRDAGRIGWALDAWRRAVHRDPALRPEIVARIRRLDPALARRFEASLAAP